MMESAMTSPKNSENSYSSSSSHQQTAIHKFVLVRKARHCHRDEEEDDDDDDDDNEDRYELEQGENWLKFLPKPSRSVLDDTQDVDGMTQEQYPSILSLASVGSLEDVLIPSKDCYLCIDVYGDVIAVKDMRLPDGITNNDSDGRGEGEIISSLDNELGVSRKDVWEPLPRRQMQLLSAGDKLCTALGHMADGSSFPGGLIFQYRSMERLNIQAANRSKPEPTTPGGTSPILTQPQEDEATELGTQTQTEPTPVKSSKDNNNDMDIAKDDGNDDEDSEKTLEFDLQQPLGPSEILATQPNSDSDDDTSLGEGGRHSGDSHRLDQAIPAQVIFTSNSEDDEAEEKRKSVPFKDQEPEDSQATVSDSQRTDVLGQNTQDVMTQATLRNSQLTAALHGETQDATQATQLTMALQGETQDATQTTVRNSQLTTTLCGETQDATQDIQLTVALQGETQDATQGAAHESSLTNTGLVQIYEKNDNDKAMEEASSQSSEAKSETLLGETGPDRPATEPFPDPIIQDILKDDDVVPSTSVEAGRVSLSQESIIQDKKQTLEKDAIIPLNTALSSEPVTGTDVEEKENSAPPAIDDGLDEKVEKDHPDTSDEKDHPATSDQADAIAIKESGSPTYANKDKKQTMEKDAKIPLDTALSSEPVTGTDVEEKEDSAPPAIEDRLDEKVEKDHPATSDEADAIAIKENGSPTDANNENRSQNAAATPKTSTESEHTANADENEKAPPLTLGDNMDDTVEPNPQDMSAEDVDSIADQESKPDARDKQKEITIKNETANARDQTIQDDNEMPRADDDDDDEETQLPGEPISRDVAATDDKKSPLQSQTSKQEKATQQGTPQAVCSPGYINLDHRSPAEGEEDDSASHNGSESEVKEETAKLSPESNDNDDEPIKSDPVKKETTLSAESKSKSSEPDQKLTLEQPEPAAADTKKDNRNDVIPSTPALRSSRRSRKSPSSSNTTSDRQPASKRQRIEDTEASRPVPRSTTKRKTASTVAPAFSRKKKQSNPTDRPGREEESAVIRVMTTGISLTDPQKNVSAFRLYRTSM
jgi:hypothetical protein